MSEKERDIQITGGHVLLSRMIFESSIWRKPPQYFRLWVWLIGKAVFQDGHTFKGHVLKRGELITTYAQLADALSYCHNRATIKPTTKEVRIMLSWLRSEGMILLKPLIGGTLPNKGRHNDLTRAYLGLLISIVEYNTYQDLKSYKGRDKGRPSDELGQIRERMRVNKIFSSDSVEVRLTEFLLQKILSRNPKFKNPNIQSWAKQVDYMIRMDKRTPEEIRTVIEWSQNDPFWKSNILSTSKLREKFDQLTEKMPSIKAVSTW